MPGLAKALKRKRQEAYPTKLDAIFDWHTRYAVGTGINSDGRPILLVGVFCNPEQFDRYAESLSRATSARIRTVDDSCALDLFGPRRPIGRLFASFENKSLPLVLSSLDDDDTLEVHLVNALSPDNSTSARLPSAVDQVSMEEFHGDPVEVGEGDYPVTTVSAHDGTIFVHRFQSKEEADAQLKKNIAANEPFTDADLN